MKVTRHRKIQWAIPLMLWLAMVVDVALPAIFPVQFLGNGQTIVSHLTLFLIVTVAFYFRDSPIIWYSLLIGLVFDGFSGLILGLYGTAYCLTAYVISKIKRYFPKKVWIHWLLFVVVITLVDFIVFVFYRETGYTMAILTQFIVNKLVPTLLFNTVLSFVLYLPMKSLLKWLGYEEYIIF